MSTQLAPLFMLLAGLLGSGVGMWGRASSENKKARLWMDGLYPLSAAFFLGFLLTVLLPHVVESPLVGLPAFLAGYVAMVFWVKRVTHHDPCCEVGHDPHPVGLATALAMSVCSVNDGLLIGILQPNLVSGVNLGMLLHKVTSSFALTQLLLRGRKMPVSPLLLSILYAFISPISYEVGQGIFKPEGRVFSLALGLSAGILSYSIWTGMLPHSRRIWKERPIALVGFIVALALSLAFGYGHHLLHTH